MIQSRCKDDWRDFKREHHYDKAKLVHDITCMANSQANRDSYIIFGIEDRKSKILGVENDTNRQSHDYLGKDCNQLEKDQSSY